MGDMIRLRFGPAHGSVFPFFAFGATDLIVPILPAPQVISFRRNAGISMEGAMVQEHHRYRVQACGTVADHQGGERFAVDFRGETLWSEPIPKALPVEASL